MGDRVLYNLSFRVMGGGGVLRFVHDAGRAEADRIARKAVGEAERIERKYSRYLPGSIVSWINRDAGKTPVAVDPETERLVREALRLAEATGGAFDPTVGVMRRIWNFREPKVPETAEVEALLEEVDYRQVRAGGGCVFLRRAGMELDLGGIGKEYAADRMAGILKEEGIESAVINLAGDLRTVGTRGDGRPWKLGVADPREQGKCRFSVRLTGDGGVASSGDYERFFVKDGVRYHHLLDARTGWPARGVAATTVVGPTAFQAGLAATAAFLLGPVDGRGYLESSPGLEGAVITESGELLATSGLDRYSDLPDSLYARYPTL